MAKNTKIPKFPVTCPHCGKTINKLGIHSYVEAKCPYCQTAIWAKSSRDSVKVCLDNE